MNSFPVLRRLALLVLCCLALAAVGCGNKGDLVRPGKAPAQATG